MKIFNIKLVLVAMAFLFFSCEEYLDVAPEAVLDKEEVFKDFEHAQGFVEEMYALVVDPCTSSHTWQSWLFGDEAYGGGTPAKRIDLGDLGFWPNYKYCFFVNNWDPGKRNSVTNADPRLRPGLWEGSLQGIRKANMILENIDYMVNATEEERKVILGQAYFFRAFFHNEIMKYWGRYPYITEVLSSEFKLQRPETYREVALLADADYAKAAELLPVNWDDEEYGQRTNSQNTGRLTKGAAYALKGKNLLLAASPLMKGNNSATVPNTYEYDTELCEMAVEAFAEVLKLVDNGRYALVQMNEIEKVFWDTKNNRTWPGDTEFIFNALGGNPGTTRRFMGSCMPKVIHGEASALSSPNHKFIYNHFGMSNGLSIEDDIALGTGSTYDPNKPFENRDPRFYKWIVVNDDLLGKKATVRPEHRRAQLFTDDGNGNVGEHRKAGASETGYLWKKYWPTLGNKWNNLFKKKNAMRIHMRLTDVYLMYAEALAGSGSYTTNSTYYPMSAVGALNALRDRANMPHIHADNLVSYEAFMDELRRERAVELSFEGHRWIDLRRWAIAHLDKYRVKTALDFPKNAQSANDYQERVLITRVCYYPKHYWMPFEANQTQMYTGFPQNPGW